MNKPIYLGLSILDLSKIVMYTFWYDYIKLKYQDNAKTILYEYRQFYKYIKTNDVHEDIAKDVEKWFDTSNYECDRPLPKGKNKKAIRYMKDELGGKIMTELETNNSF